MKILLATTNQGKLKEYFNLLQSSSLQLITLDQLPGVAAVNCPELGVSFGDNARRKAQTFGRHFNLPTLADDSGLLIDALNGFPGVYTSRFARDDYQQAISQLLQLIKQVPTPQRTAKFVCCLAFFQPPNIVKTFTGKIRGLIARQPAGRSGFGFDPIFYLPRLKKTLAQLTLIEKNQCSHRSQALKKWQASLR